MVKSKELSEMRAELIQAYPTGVIRGQLIADMPEYQVYAIYKSHVQRKIPMDKPRMFHTKQISGQMNMFSEM